MRRVSASIRAPLGISGSLVSFARITRVASCPGVDGHVSTGSNDHQDPFRYFSPSCSLPPLSTPRLTAPLPRTSSRHLSRMRGPSSSSTSPSPSTAKSSSAGLTRSPSSTTSRGSPCSSRAASPSACTPSASPSPWRTTAGGTSSTAVAMSRTTTSARSRLSSRPSTTGVSTRGLPTSPSPSASALCATGGTCPSP